MPDNKGGGSKENTYISFKVINSTLTNVDKVNRVTLKDTLTKADLVLV
jgi:hypothetical protein